MTTTFDIDEIERLLAGEETSGPWWNEGCEIFYLNDSGQRCTLIYGEGGHGEHDAALIVTLHNSAPAMIAELRELRAENARLREVVKHYADTLCEGIGECVGDFCGMLSSNECGGCFARAALGEPQ